MVHRCTDDYDTLDIRKIDTETLLQPGGQLNLSWSRGSSITIKIEDEGVRLFYKTRGRGTDDWKSNDYPIGLTWTACNYGGRRPWWICPTNGCGRRVAVLFSCPLFACRHCQQLAYRSQRDTQEDRAYRKAGKLRKRMGWRPGIAYGIGEKPKGMHWSTFNNLKDRYWLHYAQALGLGTR
jgi:hypothetical protein